MISKLIEFIKVYHEYKKKGYLIRGKSNCHKDDISKLFNHEPFTEWKKDEFGVNYAWYKSNFGYFRYIEYYPNKVLIESFVFFHHPSFLKAFDEIEKEVCNGIKAQIQSKTDND